MGLANKAVLVLVRAGEGALLVAEKGALHKGLRQGGAVDDDEVLIALGEFSWMARAKTPARARLPVMRTEASEFAAWARMSKQFRIRGDEPMIPSHFSATAGVRDFFSSRYWRAREKGASSP